MTDCMTGYINLTEENIILDRRFPHNQPGVTSDLKRSSKIRRECSRKVKSEIQRREKNNFEKINESSMKMIVGFKERDFKTKT